MHLCLTKSRRKRTITQKQVLEVCTEYIVRQMLPDLQVQINKKMFEMTNKKFDFIIPTNSLEIMNALESAVNFTRSNPMHEKVVLNIKKNPPLQPVLNK